jgi:hypothetical protein
LLKTFEFLPIFHNMSGVRMEMRTAINALVKVSWEGEDGVSHDGSAWMEDTSPSGTCIRLKAPIALGATVKVNWRWGEFAGIAKYCRYDGREYVLGLERIKDSFVRKVQLHDPSQQVRPATAAAQPAPPVPRSKPRHQKVDRNEYANAPIKLERKPVANSTLPAPQVSAGVVNNEPVSQDKTVDSQPAGPGDITDIEIEPKKSAPGDERIHMTTKWLDKALKRQTDEGIPNGNNDTPSKGNSATQGTAFSDDMPSRPARVRPQGDLQSVEDVYRAAGIINPRMGYSVTKVVEMMESDFIRGLPQEAKRAAVLMALDAAGISIEEVLRDARMRQNALEAYETDQRKTFEGYWTKKTEANDQIRLEMEQVTAEYLARIKRALDEMTSEKTKFANWQAKKKQEVERISEALGLCSKSDSSEPSSDLMPLRELEHERKSS